MAVSVDYTVIRRVLLARLETATLGTGGVARHMGDEGDEGNDLRAEHVQTNYTPAPRVSSDDAQTVNGEFIVAVGVRETESVANVDAIDRACSAVAEVFEHYGTTSGDHQVHCRGVTISITAPQESQGAPTGLVTVAFWAMRDANATIIDPA